MEGKPRYEVIRFNASKAALVLEQAKNTKNRPISKRRIGDMVRDMVHGKWEPNNDALTSSTESFEDLNNGQHRLMALVEAGHIKPNIEIDLLFGWNVPMRNIDGGRKRTLGNVLAIETTVRETTLLAATLNLIWRLRNGQMKSKRTPTREEALALLDTDSNILQSLRDNNARRIGRWAVPSVAIATHYEFSLISREMTDTFFERMYDGVNLSEGSPILHLRNQILEGRTEHLKDDNEKIKLSALFIKAFNYHRQYATITKLKWSMHDTFPEIDPTPQWDYDHANQ